MWGGEGQPPGGERVLETVVCEAAHGPAPAHCGAAVMVPGALGRTCVWEARVTSTRPVGRPRSLGWGARARGEPGAIQNRFGCSGSDGNVFSLDKAGHHASGPGAQAGLSEGPGPGGPGGGRAAPHRLTPRGKSCLTGTPLMWGGVGPEHLRGHGPGQPGLQQASHWPRSPDHRGWLGMQSPAAGWGGGQLQGRGNCANRASQQLEDSEMTFLLVKKKKVKSLSCV